MWPIFMNFFSTLLRLLTLIQLCLTMLGLKVAYLFWLVMEVLDANCSNILCTGIL